MKLIFDKKTNITPLNTKLLKKIDVQNNFGVKIISKNIIKACLFENF